MTSAPDTRPEGAAGTPDPGAENARWKRLYALLILSQITVVGLLALLAEVYS